MITKKTAPAKGTPKKKLKTETEDPIDAAIRKFEQKLCTADLKLADYLRLLQIRKERDENRPRQITVRWIENWENERKTD